MLSGIYCIEDRSSGKRYYGRSKDVFLRWKRHLHALAHNKHPNPRLQHIYNKRGWDNFCWRVVVEAPPVALPALEQLFIDRAFHHGIQLNLRQNADGGDAGAWTDETRAKHKASLERYYSTHPEARAKLAENIHNRPKEMQDRFYAAGRTRERTESSRLKVSLSITRHHAEHPGQWSGLVGYRKDMSEEEREVLRLKMSRAAQTRPPISEETRLKLKNRTGRVVSESTRLKIAASVKAAWADKPQSS